MLNIRLVEQHWYTFPKEKSQINLVEASFRNVIHKKLDTFRQLFSLIDICKYTKFYLTKSVTKISI